MFPLLDVISVVGGLIAPPLVDIVKKIFVKPENDTPERTIGSLATTKPEVLPEYIKGMVGFLEAKIKWENRDVIGSASKWVIDLRAAIRPIGVSLAFITLILMVVLVLTKSMPAFDAGSEPAMVIAGVRATCETMISSWFGHRISIRS